MMHGLGKSDPAIVAVKPTNKAGRLAAEPVERRAGTEGNAGQQSTHRAQNRVGVSQALERVRQVVNRRPTVTPVEIVGSHWFHETIGSLGGVTIGRRS
jgi:hypothetical protein